MGNPAAWWCGGTGAPRSTRLDYLSRLGVTTIWLNPIHPSPRRDGGYDITDHYGVHPRFGSFGDFVMMLNGPTSGASG
jgi:glycosidase